MAFGEVPKRDLIWGGVFQICRKTLFESPPKIDLKIIAILDGAGRLGSLEDVASETLSFGLWWTQAVHFEFWV